MFTIFDPSSHDPFSHWCSELQCMSVSLCVPPPLLCEGGTWFGVDINSEDIADNFESFVWEPALVKRNALTAASEAACLLLSVDETIRNPKSAHEAPGALPGQR